MASHRSVRRAGLFTGLLALAIAMPSVAPLGLSLATPAGQPIPPPPIESLEQTPLVAPGAPHAKPAAKLDSALDALAATPALAAAADQIEVVVVVDPAGAEAAQARIAELGGTVRIVSVSGAELQATVPTSALASLAAHPHVQLVRRPDRMTSPEHAVTAPEAAATDAATPNVALFPPGEGLTAMGVRQWHAAGITGRGLRVGIIENDFAGYQALLGTALPPAERVVYQNFADPASTWGRGPYGTAQAEVLHAVVPDATLYLARVTSELEFEQAAEWMRREGVSVVGSYLGSYNTAPGDGTGFLADVIARTRAAGLTWITGAQHVRLQHWGGNAFDSDGDRYLEVEGPRQINAFSRPFAAGELVRAYLRWSDWTFVNQDLELVIVRWNGFAWVLYAESSAWQNGQPGQRPNEWIEVPASGPTTYYGVAIRRFNADRVLNVDVTTYFPTFLNPTYERSLLTPGDALAGITVGAVDARPPYGHVDYSGEGPLNGPGGVRDGGVAKPDLAGPSAVTTRTFPQRDFQGTGAAVAHVIGAAALVRDAYPDLSPLAVKTFLASRAIDIDLSGRDARTGHGLVHLGPPPDTYRAPNDFTNDRKSDILWRSDLLGRSLLTTMDGTRVTDVQALPPGGNVGEQALAVGDFNNDGHADVLWLNPVSGLLSLRLTGGALTGRWLLNPHWVVAGSGDFNGDGTADLFFRNERTGINTIWLMRDGDLLFAYAIDSVAARWKVVGVGDLDGDGRSDILWRSSVSGRYRSWLLDGREVRTKRFLATAIFGSGWRVAALADFDGDRVADILWQNNGGGAVWVDYLRDGQPERLALLDVASNPRYRIVAADDYNGDRRADLLWRDMLTGGIHLSLRDGPRVLEARNLIGAGLGWSVVGPGSYDGVRLPFAGAAGQPAAVLSDDATQQSEPEPGDPGGPIGETPSDPNPGTPPDPRTPDPGTPEEAPGEPVDTVTLPESATAEEITALILNLMLADQPATVYLPLVRW